MKELRIKDICDKGSSNLKQKDVEGKNGLYPVYGASGIISHIDTYHQEDNYIAIVKDGSGIGRVTFMPAKSSVIGTMQYILPKEGFNINYIGYCLQSLDLSKYKQGAAIPHIYFRDYGERIVKVTEDKNEQQSIVDYLDSAFAKIDAMKANAEKALNEAKALFQASLKEMLEPKEGWEEKTLKTICIFSQGIQVPLSNQFENKGEGLTRFLRIIDFTQGNEPPRYVQIVDRKYWLEKDGIAIVRYGASTGYICTGLEGTLANNLFKVTIKDGIKLLYKYLFWWLNSKTFQSEIKKQMNGAAMPAISFGMINDIKINFPSLQEQQTIVTTLDSLKSKVDRLQENYDKISQECDALKQAILRQVFE